MSAGNERSDKTAHTRRSVLRALVDCKREYAHPDVVQADSRGLMRDNKPPRPPDIAALTRGAGPLLPKLNPCLGLEQLAVRLPVWTVTAAGQLGMFKIPDLLSRAQTREYDGL